MLIVSGRSNGVRIVRGALLCGKPLSSSAILSEVQCGMATKDLDLDAGPRSTQSLPGHIPVRGESVRGQLDRPSDVLRPRSGLRNG